MKELIEEFLEELRTKRNRSIHTVSAYHSDLMQFYNYFVERHPNKEEQGWEKVSMEDLSSFMEFLRERGYSSPSRVRKISALRTFFWYLHAKGIIKENPAQNLVEASPTRSKPKRLEDDQVKKLLEAPDPSTVQGLRDRAMLLLIYGAGLRASEVVSLDLDSFNEAEKKLFIPVSERIVYLSENTANVLKQYINEARPQLVSKSGNKTSLFVNVRGDRLTRQGLWTIFKRYAYQVGLPKGTSIRTLRNTSRAYRGESDLYDEVVSEPEEK
jgi:integrase/recombinase XerD